MRIGIFSTFFTGATLPFCQHLHKRGHSVEFFLFARQGQGGLETFVFDKPVVGSKIQNTDKGNHIYGYLDTAVNVSIVPYYIVKSRKYLIGFWNYYKNIKILQTLSKTIEKKSYDIIYVIVNEELDYLLCKQLKDRGYKNVFIAYHEVLLCHTGTPKLKTVVKRTLNLGWPVIVHSEHTKRILYDISGYENIHTVYFGPFETYKLHDSKAPLLHDDYILFIGHILPYKGLSFLYDTISEYENDVPYKVVIAGGGADNILEKVRQDEKFIVINRFLSDAEFANLVKFAKCIICPYKSGSQSGITHTAMVFGVPVIATKVAAFPECIVDRVNGVLIEYGDTEQLYSVIKDMHDAPKIEQNVPKHLQWDSIIDNFERLCVNFYVQG